VTGDAAAPPGGRPALHRIAVAGLLVCCTVLGLAGTDLVLPAVPGLPAVLGGSAAQAQLVLATFAAGTGVGLLLFGEVGSLVDHRPMLAAALLGYALLSAAAALATSLPLLIALRFLQGVAASCAAVVTPGMVRALFDERGALRAIGVLGSVESLAPAIAPIIGVWLLSAYGWRGSFWVTALLALLLGVTVLVARHAMPARRGKPSRVGYWLLLRNAGFQRQALSQGLALASLLVFVFAMPTVFVAALDGTLRDFITMQLIGISSFIVAANLSSQLVARFGAEATILGGSLLALAGATAMLAYALAGGGSAVLIWVLFVPFNMGFGFRGPPAFLAALQAADGDDGRASALVILYVMLFTAGGTALVAPVIERGLAPAAFAALACGGLSLLIFRVLRPRDR
jgi:DHA1 family bicyclomycin/chloramphenicol resistance-like MFS transporter